MTVMERRSAAVPAKLLGARIRRARKNANLSQGTLADLVGCSRVHVARLEAGAHHPSDELLGAIARRTGEPLSALLREPMRKSRKQEITISAEDRDRVTVAANSLLEALLLAVKEAKATIVEYEDEA